MVTIASRTVPWAFLLVMLGIAVVTASPRGTPAPSDPLRFDGMRALEAMDRVIGVPAEPRPIGSARNRAVRERLLTELEALGLQPQTVPFRACRGEVCFDGVNILADLVPDAPGDPVLLVAHYDSVPQGPGVGDDGHALGVVLEAIRVAQSRGPTRHPLAVLVTDGEEAGLLGARAMVDTLDLDRVRAVVNLEARGTEGQSYLFETSTPNGPLTQVAGAAVPGLRFSSLFVEVYRRMPNATDLTVFLETGVPSVNFAFLGGGEHYHTPRDDREHLDPRTVHMQGHQATEVWWALAQSDADLRTGTDDVYADVLGLFVLRWPVPWAAPLAALVLLAVLGIGVLNRERASLRWLVVWSAVAALGVLVAVAMPGASYLFVAPAGWAAVVGAAWLGIRRGPRQAWALAAAWLGVTLWLELLVQLPEAVGPHPVVVGVPLLLSVLMVVPALEWRAG